MTENLTGTLEYFNYLVESGETLLADNKYEDVSSDILGCYNNMRNGWTNEVDDLFGNPKTPVEEKLVERMKDIMVRTVGGILETAQPGPDFSRFVELEHIAVQLYRLREKAPLEMVQATRQLLERSHQMGAPEAMSISVPALELLSRVEKPL